MLVGTKTLSCLQLACCSVSQFSWFMAVSRPVQDSCSLTPAGALLVSRSDPGIKLRFPPDSTVQTRTVTLQVKLNRSRNGYRNNVSLFARQCQTLVSLAVGAGGFWVGGAGSVWGSWGQSQSPPLSLPDLQLTLPAASPSSDPSASRSHRSNKPSRFSCRCPS